MLSETELIFLIISVITTATTIISQIYPIRNIIYQYKIRHIRKIFGYKNGDEVLLVCSELYNPTERQIVEDREFIYLMKYGDIDAWVEFMLSMVKAFPKVDFKICSSGEALTNRSYLEGNIALIGGPDYNKLTEYFITSGKTRFKYGDKDGEITLVDRRTNEEYFYTNLDNDFGHIEKFPNPYNKEKSVVMFGGCHTVGVTAAVKFFSVFSNGKSTISNVALTNAKRIIGNKGVDDSEFVLLIRANKIGATICYPSYDDIIWPER